MTIDGFTGPDREIMLATCDCGREILVLPEHLSSVDRCIICKYAEGKPPEWFEEMARLRLILAGPGRPRKTLIEEVSQ